MIGTSGRAAFALGSSSRRRAFYSQERSTTLMARPWNRWWASPVIREVVAMGHRTKVLVSPTVRRNDMEQNIQPQDDKFARQSFGWRQMTSGQLWGITIVAAAVVIAVLLYVANM
jgi:hypothetical protein